MSFYVVKDVNVQKGALSYLDIDNSRPFHETTGQYLSDSKYAWLSNDSKIIVVNCKNGGRVGSWDFSTTVQDDTTSIVSVNEIKRPHGKEPLLAVSLNCCTKGGIVCIFDFMGSQVVRSIEIIKRISCVHVIDTGEDLLSLSGPLRIFDGILAVGTEGGDVFIIDLCRQLFHEGFNSMQMRDEFSLTKIEIVNRNDLLDMDKLKKNALKNESHLAIYLNVVKNNFTGHFVLKEPNGMDKVHVNKEEVLISALHYCPQLGSILIGFNFGAFQLWNLMSMKLVYTSPICEDHVPISKFAIQEPADDPRAYCYVWAVYSSNDLNSSLLPNLVMYALCYESKEFHECYGILYENFQHCGVRFQMELGFNKQSFGMPNGGQCLRLETLGHRNSANNYLWSSDTSQDISSLCMVIWKAVSDSGQFTYMALLDLNQWYKAQMPNTLNWEDCNSFMIIMCATDITDSVDEVIDMTINEKSIQQFKGTQNLEEHYYPSSLSFETHSLIGNRCITIQFQSVQKALMYQLQSAGPLCLIRPSEIYEEIITTGLSPLFTELSSPLDLNNQRRVILNVALEQQLMNWLCKCASEWANGSFSSAGCSLELLISWAFQRGITVKNNCDKLCVPLFDYSELKLDSNTTNTLNNCIKQIKNIAFFMSFVKKNLLNHVMEKDQFLLQSNILQMVELYFDVLQWLFNVGLLPEHNTTSECNAFHCDERIRAPYPAEELAKYFRNKRSENHLKTKRTFKSNLSVLFIDNLIDVECGGDKLMNDWKVDGGDGFYPPRSLQLLLRTYLSYEIEISDKHALVIYLFLDLARILDSEKYATVITHLIKFPAVFKVSPSLIKITQAFWQLDHGDFSTAMEQLLDPLIHQNDLKIWHHKIAIKSLLIHDQFNFALLYMQIRKPPILDDDDVLSAISLFVSNNMLDEAFYLEKYYNSFFDKEKLIKHFLKECISHKCLSNIMYRNLTKEHEELFLRYLDEIEHPEATDMKIAYFIQRSHYIEAFKAYEKGEQDPSKRGLSTKMNSKVRDEIIHNYKKILPTINYKFMKCCEKKPTSAVWKEVALPEPMSVYVHKCEGKSKLKSSLFLAALSKAKQTFTNSKNINLANTITEELPFIRTPTVMFPSRKRSSVQIIVPKILDEDLSPPKRARLMSESDTLLSDCEKLIDASIHTPIVLRKDETRSPCSFTRELKETPASILSKSPNHRKPISRTSIVRFDISKSSSSEQSTPLSSKSLSKAESEIIKPHDVFSFSNSSKNSTNPSITHKSSSESDEVYYSPNSSLNNIEEIPKDESRNVSYEIVGNENEEKMKNTIHIEEIDTEEKVMKNLTVTSTSSLDNSVLHRSSSPKPRISYRRTSSERTLVRSSPRLKKSIGCSKEKSEESHQSSNPVASCSSSKVVARKSLSRRVLENNAFSLHFAGTEISKESLSFSDNLKVAKITEEHNKIGASCSDLENSLVYSKNNTSVSEHHTSSFLESTVNSDSVPEIKSVACNTLNLSESFIEFLHVDLQEQSKKIDDDVNTEVFKEEQLQFLKNSFDSDSKCEFSDSLLEFVNHSSKTMATESGENLEEIPQNEIEGNDKRYTEKVLGIYLNEENSESHTEKILEDIRKEEEIDENGKSNTKIALRDVSNDENYSDNTECGKNENDDMSYIYENLSDDEGTSKHSDNLKLNIGMLEDENRSPLLLIENEPTVLENSYETPSVFERNISFLSEGSEENRSTMTRITDATQSKNESVQEVIEVSSSSSHDNSSSVASSPSKKGSSSNDDTSSGVISTKSLDKNENVDDEEITQNISSKKIMRYEEPQQTITGNPLIVAEKVIGYEDKLLETDKACDLSSTPSRRLTRRQSRLSESENLKNSNENEHFKHSMKSDTTEKDSNAAPTSESSRRSMLSVDPAPASEVNLTIQVMEKSKVQKPVRTYTRKKAKRVDNPPTKNMNEPKTSQVVTVEPILTKRKLRSASVDETASNVEDKSSSISGKTRNERENYVVKTTDVINKYTSSRRLTRKQASILESTLERNTNEGSIDFVAVEQQDPIKLLDKPNFAGIPDPEEQKIYQTSPASSGISESASKTRRRKSHSTSDFSEKSSITSDISIPRRRLKRSKTTECNSPIIFEEQHVTMDSTISKRTRKSKRNEQNQSISSSISTRSRTSLLSGQHSDQRKRNVKKPSKLKISEGEVTEGKDSNDTSDASSLVSTDSKKPTKSGVSRRTKRKPVKKTPLTQIKEEDL